jgi:plasmid maintenance system antidote protein VapI
MTEAMAVSASVAFRLGKVGSISIEEVMNMERTLSSRNMPRPGDPRTIKKLTDLFYKE